MFERITRKTAFYAVGGAIGAAIAEIIAELSPLHDKSQTVFEAITYTALWMGLVALGISLGLVLAQNFSLRRAPSAMAIGKAAGIGAISGVIAGALAQILYGSFVGGLPFAIARIFQALCWGLAGLGVGFGVALFVPNYPKPRAILAGFLGGAIGGGVFVLLGLTGIPGGLARVIGVAILGAAIGLTISAVEEMLREAWLTIIWSKNETSTVSLGEKRVVLGGASEADVRLPRSKFPPVTAILTVENGKVMLDNKLNNQKIALPNGSKINIGKITIVVNIRKRIADKKVDIKRR
jgi:hypothetical protein